MSLTSETLPRPTADLLPAVRALSDAASTPSLVALSYALRHPETWPEGFVWEYNNCRKCAMGLAIQLWHMHANNYASDRQEMRRNWKSWAARNFALPLESAEAIFFDTRASWKLSAPISSLLMGAVTPTHVADAIDAYVATASAP